MAFRRFSNSRRAFGSRRFRSRAAPRLKQAKTPQRWKASDFFVAVVSDHPTGSGTMQLNMLHLASLNTSYGGTEYLGLSQNLRAIDIGGIVFDYGIEFPSTAGDGDDPGGTLPENMSAFYNVGLCYDRQNFDDGTQGFVPGCIQGWEPFFSDFPTNTAALDLNQWEAQRPTRVLWNKTHFKSFAAPIVLNNEEGNIYATSQQRVETRNGTVNRRLRVRLDENYGLYLYVATLNEGGFAVDARALFRTVWFKGTLYWRAAL